jgi:hypothetical protein
VLQTAKSLWRKITGTDGSEIAKEMETAPEDVVSRWMPFWTPYRFTSRFMPMETFRLCLDQVRDSRSTARTGLSDCGQGGNRTAGDREEKSFPALFSKEGRRWKFPTGWNFQAQAPRWKKRIAQCGKIRV